jgi:micrococcal nuclease
MKLGTIFFLLLLAPIISGQKVTGKIYRVVDGDTFIFQSDSSKITVRLQGIDAPELSQVFGVQSKQFLNTFLGSKCFIDIRNLDKYGRTVAILWVDTINVNLLSIRKGYSWYYPQYYRSSDFANAQAWAQFNKLGLWQYSGSIPPWVFRKAYKNKFR